MYVKVNFGNKHLRVHLASLQIARWKSVSTSHTVCMCVYVGFASGVDGIDTIEFLIFGDCLELDMWVEFVVGFCEMGRAGRGNEGFYDSIYVFIYV